MFPSAQAIIQKIKPKPAKVVVVVDALPGIRKQLAALMDATVRNEPNWHYKEARPLVLPSLATAEHGTVVSDCSFGCVILCHLAGAGDPTGNKFDGYGNSTSMYEHLKTIPQAQAQTGDMVVLGSQGRLHAMMIRSTLGGDPLCWSHGSESGPKPVPLSAEVAYHAALFADGGVVTFLRLTA